MFSTWPLLCLLLLWLSIHLATLPYFSFVTKGHFITLPPLFFLQNMGVCHLFSPWFPHENNQSGMSGQADYGCFMKRTPQSWTLIYLIFYYLWRWISEQSYTLFSCHFSHCPLILGKKKKQRDSEHSPISLVFTQHTLCATVHSWGSFPICSCNMRSRVEVLCLFCNQL